MNEEDQEGEEKLLAKHAGVATAMGPSTTATNSTPAGGSGAGTILVSEEYRNLVDKSFRKFSQLREFPPYGRNKWDTYFHKAFQVYSKLWKFQQENREELMRTGLKRWEIGEIASRIGQLYYNYYLRTSDYKFLSESWIFYDAIMVREYFKDTGKDTSLVNKHLRFYARFIVVCLLLNKRKGVNELVRKFRALVDEHSQLFQGNDGKDWKLVVQEIVRFMKADACCEVGRPLRYSISLDPHYIPEVKCPDVGKPLRLHDAILASYYHNEVKFNELTLDTFRMLQSLEWEPTGALYRPRSTESSSGSGNIGLQALPGPSVVNKGNLHLQIPDPSLPPNPHKYILYRPTVSSLLLVLATACEELSSDSILLLYISAAGSSFAGKPPRSSVAGSISASSTSGSEVNLLSPTENAHKSGSVDSSQASAGPGQNGALPGSSSQLSSRQNSGNLGVSDSHNSGGLWLGSKRSAGVNYLFPSDLLPFTRRPLLIVIDSDNSSAFEVISGHERGESAALLLSPTVQATDEKGTSGTSSSGHSGGNLFTFFLTAPVQAFCRVVGVSSTSQPLKLQQGILDQVEKTVSELAVSFGESLAAAPSIDSTWGRILGDPFLRQMVFRFVLCRATFSLHTLYHNRQEYVPRCLPKLPEEASPTHRIVESGVFQLASQLGVVDQFLFSPSTLPGSRSNGELKWKGKSPPENKDQVSETSPTHVGEGKPTTASDSASSLSAKRFLRGSIRTANTLIGNSHCETCYGDTDQHLNFEKMKFNQYDVVQFLVPVEKLAAGAIGVVVMLFFDSPAHYEVEFLDQEGKALTISEKHLKRVEEGFQAPVKDYGEIEKVDEIGFLE